MGIQPSDSARLIVSNIPTSMEESKLNYYNEKVPESFAKPLVELKTKIIIFISHTLTDEWVLFSEMKSNFNRDLLFSIKTFNQLDQSKR